MSQRRLLSYPYQLLFFSLGCVCSLSCNQPRTPIQRALYYLGRNQVPVRVQYTVRGEILVDFEGDWPQFFWFEELPEVRVREVSPFVVAFIHHALTSIVPENLEALGLNPQDLLLAQTIRKRSVRFMQSFEAHPEDLDAGAFGFWPYDSDPNAPETLSELLMLGVFRGPILMGTRVPLNLPVYPRQLALPCDADVTGAVYAALLDNELVDGGPASTVPFEGLFEDWRDMGEVPRRLNPDWLPYASGAFLTWLTYQEVYSDLVPNDVDLAVNATVLYALGRYKRLDTPGVAEAIALINSVTQQGLHRTRPEDITDYYPDNFAFHYFVSRACAEGGVVDLRPAVETLADDVEQSALSRDDGLAYWDRGSPHLNTAFAVLTLLNAGRDSLLIARGIDYLVAEQDPVTGGWEEGAFFIARLDGGQRVDWGSSSFTTAMALEALCRYELSAHSQGESK